MESLVGEIKVMADVPWGLTGMKKNSLKYLWLGIKKSVGELVFIRIRF